MAISYQGLFSSEIMSDNKAMDIIESRDRQLWVCGSSGQNFHISVRQLLIKPRETFGVRLYIDGELVNNIKTFRYESNIHGFKMGGGNYKRFLFDIPESNNENEISQFHKGENLGKIILKFFSTKKMKIKKRNSNKSYNYQRFEPKFREEGVKFFERPLAIKEGKSFQLDSDKSKFAQDGDYIDDYVIDFHDEVDQITINYTDFDALQIKGVISLYNIYHLKHIPQNLLFKEDYIITAFKTILEKHKRLTGDDLEKWFKTYTHKDLKKFYQFEHVIDFINQKAIMHFSIEEKKFISNSNPEEFIKKLCTLPIKPPKEYFERNSKTLNNSNYNTGNSQGSMNEIVSESRKTNMSKSLLGSISIRDENVNMKNMDNEEEIIYITDDEEEQKSHK